MDYAAQGMAHIDQILTGDIFQVAQTIPDQIADLTITSPPYFNQRQYTEDAAEIGNEQSSQHYIDKLLLVFDQCVRITKPTGSIIWNIGDKYKDGRLQLIPYRFAIQAECRAQIINNICWTKTNPSPRQFDRRMVSSHEPFFHFVLTNRYKYFPDAVRNIREIKTGGNIGQGYFPQIEASDLSVSEKAAAREELSAAIAEVKSGEIKGLRMKIRGVHQMAYGGQEGGRNDQIKNKGFTIIKLHGKELLKDIIESPVETIRGIKHPAVYPISVVQKLIKLTTEEGDLVFDPFMGSGTTAIAAKQINRHYLGVELCPDFVAHANKRIENET